MNRPLDPDQLAVQRAAEIERHGCRSLWTAVLLLGISDARDAQQRLGTPAERRGPTHKLFESDADALGWLGTADFKQVCHLARVDPDWVLRKLKEARIHQPEQETTP